MPPAWDERSGIMSDPHPKTMSMMVPSEPVVPLGKKSPEFDEKKNILELQNIFCHLQTKQGGEEGANATILKSPPSSPRRCKRNDSERRIRPHQRSQNAIELSSNDNDLEGSCRADSRSGGDAEDEATISTVKNKRRKAKRDKLKELTRERMRDRGQRDTRKPVPTNDCNSTASGNESGRDANMLSRRASRMMLRQPSRIASGSGDNEQSESSGYSLEPSRSDLGATSSGNAGIFSSNGEDDEEDAVTVLQFDPMSTSGNVFSVKQVYNSESECEFNNADGSQSILSISEMQDPMLEAQQHLSKSLPIFDFLEDEATSNQDGLLATPPPRTTHRITQESETGKKNHRKDYQDNKLVEDAQNYRHFFEPVNMQGSPRQNHNSWPSPTVKKGKNKSSSSKRQGRKNSRKLKASREAEADGATNEETKALDPLKRKSKKTRKTKGGSSRKKSLWAASDTDNELNNVAESLSRPPPRRSKSLPLLGLTSPSSRVGKATPHVVKSNPKVEKSARVVDHEKLSLVPESSKSGKEKRQSRGGGVEVHACETDVNERTSPFRTGSRIRRRSIDLTTSIGRYFSKRKNATGTDVEGSRHDEGSVSSSFSCPSLLSRGIRNCHQLLDDESSNLSLDSASVS